MNGDDFVEVLARDFHVALAAGHAFAALYNLRRRNYLDATINALFTVYDVASSLRHHKEVYEKR
jgi:hypothetical protein